MQPLPDPFNYATWRAVLNSPVESPDDLAWLNELDSTGEFDDDDNDANYNR